MADSEELNLIGDVAAVIYQNQENGYTVLRLDAGRRGDHRGGLYARRGARRGLSVQGQWTRHPSFGEQFKGRHRGPADARRGTKAIFDYLACGAVRGIGAATARRMVEEFGSRTPSTSWRRARSG